MRWVKFGKSVLSSVSGGYPPQFVGKFCIFKDMDDVDLFNISVVERVK